MRRRVRGLAWIGIAAMLSLQAGPVHAEDMGFLVSRVEVVKQADGAYQYLVNGQPQVFIGMGYDPIYRYLSDDERAANYGRDFSILRDAGVNTITGWDADKGYEQDRFDELTLAVADASGIGVVMPMNLPPEGDYNDAAFVQALKDEARAKVARFKYFPALRMWGLGNEVFWDMNPDMYPAFRRAYVDIAELFHQLDPNHPVIYREAEDRYIPEFKALLGDGDKRPWLQYGMNIYDKDPKPLLARWPSYGLDRPLFVSEFGAEAATPDGRASGYLAMWRAIRCFSSFVMGGAPYVWTIAGPEPTDRIWGLMNSDSEPVDGTFALLSQAWLAEPAAPALGCQDAAPSDLLAPASSPTVRHTQPTSIVAPAAPVITPATPSLRLPLAQPAPSPKPVASPSPSPTTRTTTRKRAR